MYIAHLDNVFYEFYDILRDDGTLWVVIGDTAISAKSRYSTKNDTILGGGRHDAKLGAMQDGMKPDLVGQSYFSDGAMAQIPAMLADRMQRGKWTLRSHIVWYKRVHKPESVVGWQWDRHAVNNIPCDGCSKCDNGFILKRNNGRPTIATESILMFSKKNSRYFFDTDAVREKNVSKDKNNNPFGKNVRNVWEIAPSHHRKHYATFPEELARRCILASTSPAVCSNCGTPYARIRELDKSTVGWRACCDCVGFTTSKSVVADFFGGSGTTPFVARKNNREYLYIEPSELFVNIMQDRMNR